MKKSLNNGAINYNILLVVKGFKFQHIQTKNNLVYKHELTHFLFIQPAYNSDILFTSFHRSENHASSAIHQTKYKTQIYFYMKVFFLDTVTEQTIIPSGYEDKPFSFLSAQSLVIRHYIFITLSRSLIEVIINYRIILAFSSVPAMSQLLPQSLGPDLGSHLSSTAIKQSVSCPQ